MGVCTPAPDRSQTPKHLSLQMADPHRCGLPVPNRRAPCLRRRSGSVLREPGLRPGVPLLDDVIGVLILGVLRCLEGAVDLECILGQGCA